MFSIFVIYLDSMYFIFSLYFLYLHKNPNSCVNHIYDEQTIGGFCMSGQKHHHCTNK